MELADLIEAIELDISLDEFLVKRIVESAPLPTTEQRDELLQYLRPIK